MCSSTPLISNVAEYADKDRVMEDFARSEAEGKKYLGRRFTLRKEAEAHPEKILALVYQTTEMTKQSLHRGFLWSAKCLSTGREVPLFGSVHYSTIIIKSVERLKERFSELYHPIVREKFEQSECLYVEVDIAKLTVPEMQVISEVELDWSNRHLLETQPTSLSKVTESISGMCTRLSLGLDVGLMIEADLRKKPVISLETLSVQLDALRKAPFEPFSSESILDMIDSAQSGNLDQVCDLLKNTLETEPALEERNRNFTSQIKQALKTGQKAMFAFGIAHFLGKTGVLNLLSTESDIKIARIDLP